MSLSSSPSFHCLIIEFASIMYNQSSCEFDTWTSILIFTTCDKVGALANLLTSFCFANSFSVLCASMCLSRSWELKNLRRLNLQGKSYGMVVAVVVWEADSLLLSPVLEIENHIESLSLGSLLLELRAESSEIASELGWWVPIGFVTLEMLVRLPLHGHVEVSWIDTLEATLLP